MWSWSGVEVTVPPPARARRRFGSHHASLPPDEITVRDSIPVTTVRRTLLDLATVLTSTQLERAINEAEMRGHSGPLSLPDLIERYPGRTGIRTLRQILGDVRVVTRSELEVRFRRFLRAHRFP